MRKTHEVLRLHFELKLKQRQIARSANLSQSTVHEYLRRFTAAGLSCPLPEQMSEAELEAALFSADAKPPRAPARYLPDFSHIHKELQEHKHVTLQLLWEEYRATHPDGYRYSQFCHHYQQWKRQRDVVMRQQHRPGREAVCRLGGRQDLRPRTGQSCCPTGLVVRGGARSEQLHLCRSHRGRDHAQLDRGAHPSLRVYGWRGRVADSRQHQNRRE